MGSFEAHGLTVEKVRSFYGNIELLLAKEGTGARTVDFFFFFFYELLISNMQTPLSRILSAGDGDR